MCAHWTELTFLFYLQGLVGTYSLHWPWSAPRTPAHGPGPNVRSLRTVTPAPVRMSFPSLTTMLLHWALLNQAWPVGWCPGLASRCPCPHGGAQHLELGLPQIPRLLCCLAGMVGHTIPRQPGSDSPGSQPLGNIWPTMCPGINRAKLIPLDELWVELS